MSELRVRFLGSGDAFGSVGRMQSCILLKGMEAVLLLDCGASSLVAMKRWSRSFGHRSGTDQPTLYILGARTVSATHASSRTSSASR